MKGPMKTLRRSTAQLIPGLALLAVAICLAFNTKRVPALPGEAPVTTSAIPEEQPEPARPIQPTSPASAASNSIALRRALPDSTPVQLKSFEPVWTLQQSVDLLVSPKTTFAQKQAIWKRLKDAQQLGEAIADLEERVKNDPQVAEYSAVLGSAYLKGAGASKDQREQAILAMKADQTFDSALSLDPDQWEARYMKAVGLSYWPAQMNKTTEVLQRFTSLIQDQEEQNPQPEFSQAYLRLGDEYRKAGQIQSAQQVWQRGAALFPDDPDLKHKLASIQ